jgi:hypothetical protein
MTNFYNDASAAEHAEVIAKITAAEKALRNAARALALLRLNNGDIVDISSDAYNELTNLMSKLSENYDIEAMAQDALAN